MSETTYQAQKQQVLASFETTIDLANKYGTPSIEQSLKDAANYLIQGKLFVVICGEFKQGKSSSINALIDEPKLFPVDVDIATNLVTTITYGEKEEYTVFLGEYGKAQPKKIGRHEIADYVTERANKGNIKQAQLMEIKFPSPKLKEGLVLADTPGVGGLNEKHTLLSYTFIPNADVILFVSDALVPLTTDELKFIEKIASQNREILFVLTKIDKNKDYQTVVDNNREKLARVLNTPAHLIPIVPVSSYLKEVYLEDGDEEDLEDSNFPALEAELWRMLDKQRGYLLIMRSIGKLTQHLSDIQKPLKTEWDTYQQQSQEEIVKAETQLKETTRRLQALSGDNAQWLTQLSDGTMDIRRNILNRELDKSANQIRRFASKLLEDARQLENPQQIGNIITRDINNLIAELGKKILEEAQTLQTQIENNSGLALKNLEVSQPSIELSAVNLGQISAEKLNWWDKTIEVGRQASFAAGGATFIGTTIGGILGAAVGVLSGGTLLGVGVVYGMSIGGGLFGAIATPSALKKGMKAATEADLKALRKEIAPVLNQFVEDSLKDCRQELEQSIVNLERQMRDDLKGRIRQEKETAERSLRSLQDAQKLSKEDASRKAAALQVPLQQLQQLHGNIEKLAKSIIARHEAAQDESTSAPKATQPVNIPPNPIIAEKLAPRLVLPENSPVTPPPAQEGRSNYGSFADE
jgi:signal recognition particle receptor subunit beta